MCVHRGGIHTAGGAWRVPSGAESRRKASKAVERNGSVYEMGESCVVGVGRHAPEPVDVNPT